MESRVSGISSGVSRSTCTKHLGVSDHKPWAPSEEASVAKFLFPREGNSRSSGIRGSLAYRLLLRQDRIVAFGPQNRSERRERQPIAFSERRSATITGVFFLHSKSAIISFSSWIFSPFIALTYISFFSCGGRSIAKGSDLLYTIRMESPSSRTEKPTCGSAFASRFCRQRQALRYRLIQHHSAGFDSHFPSFPLIVHPPVCPN